MAFVMGVIDELIRGISRCEIGIQMVGGVSTLVLTADTYVDQLGTITLAQVMQDRGIVKIGQVRHILAFLVFGRVDLADQILLEILGLSTVCRKMHK